MSDKQTLPDALAEVLRLAAAATQGELFVSGVRFRMNGGEWHSVNRYDEALKRDENVACVGFEPRTGVGLADARLIAAAVNFIRQHGNEIQAMADDARRYRRWRKYYKGDFVLLLGGPDPAVRFDPIRPMVELLGGDYEAKIDRALDTIDALNPIEKE